LGSKRWNEKDTSKNSQHEIEQGMLPYI